jgi:hypothetical protein
MIRDHCLHLARRWSELIFPDYSIHRQVQLFYLRTPPMRTSARILVDRFSIDEGFSPTLQYGEGVRFEFEYFEGEEMVSAVREHYKAGSGERVVMTAAEWDEWEL